MTKTAHRSFDFTDTFEIGKRVDSAGEVLGESYVALDRFRIAGRAHKLHRHPKLQRVEPSRAHLAVAEEVELNVGAAAVFTQVLRRHIECIAQHSAPVAHE